MPVTAAGSTGHRDTDRSHWRAAATGGADTAAAIHDGETVTSTDGGETADGGSIPWEKAGGELDEATLVARARDRDIAAFEVLLGRYKRGIYTLCVRMLGGTGEADEIMQEVFLTAWRRLPEIEHDAAFGGWLYRTATNRCLNVLRRRKPTSELDESNTPASTSTDGDPSRAAENSAAMDALSSALQRLSPDKRAAWLLCEVHGRSYEEIAQLLDTTVGAVRGRIARARIELAEVMAPWR